MKYDILIVGGGIAGMESALTLGDMGYKVLLVEKEASIGGKMVLLSKVFPTLDCASCISTPKMAATAHHPNITVLTHSEIEQIVQNGNGGFFAKLFKNSTYVDPAACTGCGECELACTVAIPDQFNFNLAARRAAYIPYPQAVPKKALIERHGSSPCIYACPAHLYELNEESGEMQVEFAGCLECGTCMIACIYGSVNWICPRGEFGVQYRYG